MITYDSLLKQRNTLEKLQDTEKAEGYLFSLGFSDFRVRKLGDSARIQLPEDQIPNLMAHRREILTELKTINRTMGKTVVVNIHSIALARQFSDRIIALQDGRLAFDGTPAELTDDVLRMVYKGDSFLKEEARHEN